MKKILLLLHLLIISLKLCSQDTLNILHYTETTGFDHNTRTESKDMFKRICDSLTQNTSHFWVLTHRNTSEIFDTLTLLNNYDVVIWSNTSGNGGLTLSQISNYESYVNSGGSYLGIHAASDTYRHSSANGSSTGSWDFYAENLSGCSVQQSPNHTNANHNNFIDHTLTHPILNNIQNPWNKTEEYYYWENGFLDNSFTYLLEVRTTGTNSYDSTRMVAQYKELSSGGRSFYTSLGHATSNFTTINNNFEVLNKNALYWLADPSATDITKKPPNETIILYPNPTRGVINISHKGLQGNYFQIFSVEGQSIKEGVVKSNQIDIRNLPSGFYHIVFTLDNIFFNKKFQVIK